jgi:hypothetical protein
MLEEGTLTEDLGVSPNTTYTVHRVNGKNVRRRFTVGQYYPEGRGEEAPEEGEGLAEGHRERGGVHGWGSLKTADGDGVRAHVRRLQEPGVYDALWGENKKALGTVEVGHGQSEATGSRQFLQKDQGGWARHTPLLRDRLEASGGRWM